MRLEHHLVGGYVRYISPYIIIIMCKSCLKQSAAEFNLIQQFWLRVNIVL